MGEQLSNGHGTGVPAICATADSGGADPGVYRRPAETYFYEVNRRTNSFSHGELLQSRLRRARPSAFRLPASRTAGGKLHALEEGALFWRVRSSYTRNKTFLFEERLKSAPPVAESADENAEGWLPKADGRRVNPHLRDSKRRLFLVKKPMKPIKNAQHC